MHSFSPLFKPVPHIIASKIVWVCGMGGVSGIFYSECGIFNKLLLLFIWYMEDMKLRVAC